MAEVLKYSIPEWHPLVVHFPLAFVLAAAGFAVLWFVRDRIRWLSLAAWCEFLGFIGAGFAYLTGDVLKEQSEGTPIVEELVHVHEDAALVGLILTGLALLLLLLTRRFSDRDTTRAGIRPLVRLLVTLAALAAGALIAWTGHIGATMVWGVSA